MTPARARGRGPHRHSAAVGLLTLAVAASVARCTDRTRPSPVAPGADLSVQVLAPSDGVTVLTGTLQVIVHGSDTIGDLSALGVVLRAALSQVVADSTVVHFTPTTDTVVTILLQLPGVAGPLGMELQGLAFDSRAGTAATGWRAVTVLPCPPGGCPTSSREPPIAGRPGDVRAGTGHAAATGGTSTRPPPVNPRVGASHAAGLSLAP